MKAVMSDDDVIEMLQAIDRELGGQKSCDERIAAARQSIAQSIERITKLSALGPGLEELDAVRRRQAWEDE